LPYPAFPHTLLPYPAFPYTLVQQVIITTCSVLVMNPEDENVLPFITELKMKLSAPTLPVSTSYPAALNEASSGERSGAACAVAD
jgi:hypothetical protein